MKGSTVTCRLRRRCGAWLLRRIARRRIDTAQDPGEPVDTELELVADVIVRAGIERNVPRALRGGQGRWCCCAWAVRNWLRRLAVDRHHDSAIRAVLRP